MISWQLKLYSPNGRVIDDLRSPDTFDTRLGERASANVTPCTSGDSMPNLKTFQALLVEHGGRKHFYMVLKWDEDLTWDCYL